MGYFIQLDGTYYEGDKAHATDISVPQRPAANYDWNGVAWILNVARQTEADRLALIDADLKNDNFVDQFRGLDNPAYNALWDTLTPAQKDRILKKLWKYAVRRSF